MMKSNNGHIMWWLKKLVFNVPFLLVLLLVIWIQGATLFPNGEIGSKGELIFYDGVAFRDSTVHLSLIAEMQSRFPPTNFSAEGVILKNYHYLYDAFLALIVKLTNIPALFLYYKITPILLSLLLGLAIYFTTLTFTKNRWAAIGAIFFTVFGTSLGPLFGKEPNVFMTDQILGMMVNPQGILSLIIFLTLYLFLVKKNYPFFALLLGISFGVKAYGGIVFALAAAATVLLSRNKKLFFAVFLGGLLMVGWILFTIDGKVAGIKFAPFWLIEKMVVDPFRLDLPKYYLLSQHYLSLGRYFHLTGLVILGIVVYFVGSLGLRIFGLLEVFSKRKFDLATIFLFSAAAFSFLIPLFSNQSSKAYDIVQFTPYFTVFMGIMFSLTVFKFKWPIIFIAVILTLFFNKNEIFKRLEKTGDKVVFTKNQLEAVDYVKKYTNPETVFVLETNDFNLDYLWFPSLTGRRTYYSGKRFAQQVGVNIDDKQSEVESFLAGKKDLPEADYVWLPAKNADSVKIESESGFKRIFANSDVVILQRR